MRAGIASAACLAALITPQAAFAGPPYLTDDPEPVDPGHWEINSNISGGVIRTESSGVAPGFDINYGAAPNLQLHINLAAAYDQSAGGPLYYGFDDTELGVKYRFLNPGKDDWWPEVSIYPLFEIPTGSNARKGLGATGEARELFPVWLQKDFGDWTTFGGGGWWHNPGMENRNNWFFGWAVERKITDRLTLGGELFHQTAESVITTPTNASSTGFNLGLTYDVSETYHILFSAGRGFENAAETDEFTYYLALQTTF